MLSEDILQLISSSSRCCNHHERNALMLTRGPSCCTHHEISTPNSSSIYTTSTRLRNFLAVFSSTYVLPFTSFIIIMTIALLIICKKDVEYFLECDFLEIIF